MLWLTMKKGYDFWVKTAQNTLIILCIITEKSSVQYKANML